MARTPTTRPEPGGERFESLAALVADPGSGELLRRRAQELARRPPEQDTAAREPFLHFRLGRSEEYGLPHGLAEEVIAVSSIARVPCAPPAIAGVINRRGQMLPVVDLRLLFGLAAEPQPGATVDLIVVAAAGMTVGLRVDELLGMSEYRPDLLAEVLPSQGALQRSHVLGLLEGRITILNIERILADLVA